MYTNILIIRGFLLIGAIDLMKNPTFFNLHENFSETASSVKSIFSPSPIPVNMLCVMVNLINLIDFFKRVINF